MKTKKFFGLLAMLLAGGILTTGASPIRAEDSAKKSSDNPTAEKRSNEPHHAFLGVVIEPLQFGTAAHMPEILTEGQGVWIRHVSADSPADKAGIKSHDILVKYGDQKLFSIEQLGKLVAADKPGKNVDIEFIRSGKLQKAQLTLGEATDENVGTIDRAWNHQHGRLAWPHMMGPRNMIRPNQQANSNDNSNWNTFDSMSLKRQKDGTFLAEINYLDKNGKLEHHAFKGTKEEIERDIKAEKDLPATERRHLLHAFGGPSHIMFMPSQFDENGNSLFDWRTNHSEF